VFCVADIQTGFGPFVAVFLTTEKWTQIDIGLVLTVSGLVSLIGQVPLGALVDATKSLRGVSALSLTVIGACAFAFALWPIFGIVLVTRVLHAAASSLLGLSLVAISLGLVGADAVSERLGRNAAFASAGTGIAAAAMGACGVYVSSRAVFFLTGALAIPALIALSRIDGDEIGPASDAARGKPTNPVSLAHGFAEMMRNKPFLAFAFCIMVFHLANAAMLPLAASMLTLRSREAATIMVAAAIVVPQFTMSALSPWVGRTAQRRGRRPLLLLGFAALALRGFLFSVISAPELLVLAQVLDGVSAATLAVLVPLTIVDLTRAHGHFNIAQGMAGCAMGLGAAASTILAGYVADRFGSHSAFDLLTIIAVGGLLACALITPETMPRSSVRR
jgi:MFS family permease